MTSTTIEKLNTNKLIHVAKILDSDGQNRYLFLRQYGPENFVWLIEQEVGNEIESGVKGYSIEEAMRLAPRHWNSHSFRTVICGFRYTLPERDEHGINALFHQMAASYASMNGIYYDEELGNNCFVQNASAEALELFRRSLR